jgi:hypothetical protein
LERLEHGNLVCDLLEVIGDKVDVRMVGLLCLQIAIAYDLCLFTLQQINYLVLEDIIRYYDF